MEELSVAQRWKQNFLRAPLCFLSVALEVKAYSYGCPALTIRAQFVHRAHSKGSFLQGTSLQNHNFVILLRRTCAIQSFFLEGFFVKIYSSLFCSKIISGLISTTLRFSIFLRKKIRIFSVFTDFMVQMEAIRYQTDR